MKIFYPCKEVFIIHYYVENSVEFVVAKMLFFVSVLSAIKVFYYYIKIWKNKKVHTEDC